MASGIEMLTRMLVKQAFETLPPEVLENIGQIGQHVVSFKAQLDRIELNQQEIIALLRETDHGRPSEGTAALSEGEQRGIKRRERADHGRRAVAQGTAPDGAS